MKNLAKLLPVFFIIFFFPIYTFSQTEIQKGILLHNQSKFKEAIKHFKKISKKQPKNTDVLYYLGVNYLKLDEPKKARKVLEKAIKINDKDARIYTSLAYSYMKLKDVDEARKHAGKALELSNEIAEAHFVLGVISYSSENYGYSYARAKKTSASPGIRSCLFAQS